MLIKHGRSYITIVRDLKVYHCTICGMKDPKPGDDGAKRVKVPSE